MNESPPPLPQWLLLRDPGVRKPALIVKLKVTVCPGDPCHNRDGVDDSAKSMLGLSEHFFPVAQSLVEIPQLPRRFIEDSAEVCEFAPPGHADLMLKFASGQRLEPFHQQPQWLRDAAGDCYSEASSNQQRNESSDWHDQEHSMFRTRNVQSCLRALFSGVAVNVFDQLRTQEFERPELPLQPKMHGLPVSRCDQNSDCIQM